MNAAVQFDSSYPATLKPTPEATPWRDRKKWGWLLSPGLPIVAIAVTSLVSQRASPKRQLLSWGGPLLIHAVIPVLDRLIGEDAENPPESAMNALARDGYYKAITYAFVPLQYISLYVLAKRYCQPDMSLFSKLGLALSAGAVSGIAINTAHELGHKSALRERTFARLALAPSAYGHFAVEHNFGHHRRVATPEDPASSRFGETFWQFLPRTVTGGLLSAVQIEKARLRRRHQPFWSNQNELIQGWAMTGALYAALTARFGWRVWPFIGIQAIYGFSLLEVVNYLEHYGLLRQKTASDRYERVQPSHSWNSNYLVTNLFLYQLQRHADHHANPTREYQLLRHFEDAPQLPGGYASMILPAYIPSWWFKLMNPRVLAHYDHDFNKINSQPVSARPWRDALHTLKMTIRAIKLN